jgi:hypothetical protein
MRRREMMNEENVSAERRRLADAEYHAQLDEENRTAEQVAGDEAHSPGADSRITPEELAAIEENEAALDRSGQRLTDENEAEAQPNPLAVAIADHFGVPVEALSGFVLAVEYASIEGINLSSAWSGDVPAWRLRAMGDELSRHLDAL